jgi:hypothetical protein
VKLPSVAKTFEHTVVFAFFLFIFLLGAIMAARLVGTYLEPTSKSLASALEAA